MAALDDIDQRIVRELSRNGRVTNLALAEYAGLSPSACLRRVQELERSGVIRGYRAVLDRAAVKASFTAYVAIDLANHTKATLLAFERAIQMLPEVRECHNVTGTVSHLLRVEVENLQAYKAFHTETLASIEGIRSITSYIVLDSPKDERG